MAAHVPFAALAAHENGLAASRAHHHRATRGAWERLEVISFFIPGDPASKGSKKGFVNRKSGKVIMVEQAGEKLQSWNRSVYESARMALARGDERGMAYAPVTFVDTPLDVCLTFGIRRPSSHYGSKGLKGTAPMYPRAKRLDVDKLARSTLDAMTGIVFDDDGHIDRLVVVKLYAERDQPTGCLVKVQPVLEFDTYASQYARACGTALPVAQGEDVPL